MMTKKRQKELNRMLLEAASHGTTARLRPSGAERGKHETK